MRLVQDSLVYDVCILTLQNSEIGKLFKNEKLRHKKSTPEIARVFDNPPLVPRGKRNRPSRCVGV